MVKFSLELFSPVEMEVLGVVEVTGFKETKKMSDGNKC